MSPAHRTAVTRPGSLGPHEGEAVAAVSLGVMVLTLALPWVARASRHGVAGFLVAMGVDPASAAAGVVLCRIFVVGMEVPVGGLMLLWWVGGRLRLVRGSMNGHTTTLPGGTPVSPPAGMVRTTRR